MEEHVMSCSRLFAEKLCKRLYFPDVVIFYRVLYNNLEILCTGKEENDGRILY